MMNENKRYTEWKINSNLEPEEIGKVKDTADNILFAVKNNKLSHYQALRALELAKVVIDEETV